MGSSLINYFSSEGYDIYAITWDPPESDFYRINKKIKRIQIDERSNSNTFFFGILNNIRRIIKIRKEIIKSGEGPAISFLTHSNIILILSSFATRKNIIVSERSDISNQKIKHHWDILRRVFYRYSSHVTANSINAINQMKHYVPISKLKYIPNPVDTNTTEASVKNNRLILNVGRLVPLKGQHRIIDAYLRTGPAILKKWQLTILGEGVCRGSLEGKISKLSQECTINLPGNVQDPNLYYQLSGMFVMASDYEGTPNTLLEAMAHGIPCIVPDCLPGALEHIEDGVSGLVYPAGNIESLKECILTLAADPDLRERLGKEARKRMEEFSIDKIARQWEEILFPREMGKSVND